MALQFKELVWPSDPETYREVNTREPLYVTVDGVSTYSKMSSMRRVISGSGVFFGSSAYRYYRQLEALMEETSAGDLVHPKWGTRYCYFTKLQLDQEPREDYVRYSFEFTQANSKGEVPR